ncbi:unnamed protein product [Ambrosiozyma monospora]|uniref:Unnamed protein product n=1 Tax=Ambrosiozyma monospora TaxID=43982 RepID=A0ACB5UDG5_AMBMO|nr:unnamed protein product [Ambrosiozyma monospora]
MLIKMITLYIAKTDYTKSFPIYFGRKLYQITKEDELAYDHLPQGQFSVDFAVEPIEKTKEEFQAKYKETLPEGFPRLHPRCRYYTETEISSVLKSWSQDENAIVLISPGLAGGVNEPQIRAVIENLMKEGKHCLVLNGRVAQGVPQ